MLEDDVAPTGHYRFVNMSDLFELAGSRPCKLALCKELRHLFELHQSCTHVFLATKYGPLMVNRVSNICSGKLRDVIAACCLLDSHRRVPACLTPVVRASLEPGIGRMCLLSSHVDGTLKVVQHFVLAPYIPEAWLKHNIIYPRAKKANNCVHPCSRVNSGGPSYTSRPLRSYLP